jgi:hypothetical protein
MPSATYQLTDKDLLYYLHIPKTAGTSFTDVLSANFKADESSFSEFIANFLKHPPEVIAKYRAMSGHFFYNVDTFTHRTPTYITILRDPVERTISNYAYIRRIPVHYAHDIVKSQSLLEFATDPRTKPLYANSQTRYIAADPNTVEIAKSLKFNPKRPYELWERMESFAPNGFSDLALLERAKERLQKMAFVGLAEQFDEALELLCYTFGWPLPPAPKVFNVSPNRPEKDTIPQEAIDAIRENTQLDAALYELGKKLFEEHYAQMLKAQPEKIKQPSSLGNENVAAMERQIDYQKRLIDTLLEEKLQLEELVRTVRNGYESSFGWRFVLRFNAARQKVLPKGSRLEKLYLKVRDRLA